MAYTDINSEDRLVQATFAEHLEKGLGWESVYAWNDETFGPDGTMGRADTREVVLTRDLRVALVRLNPQLPSAAVAEAVGKLTRMTSLSRCSSTIRYSTNSSATACR
jgi:type I restriction enzyme, R subunit